MIKVGSALFIVYLSIKKRKQNFMENLFFKLILTRGETEAMAAPALGVDERLNREDCLTTTGSHDWMADRSHDNKTSSDWVHFIWEI